MGSGLFGFGLVLGVLGSFGLWGLGFNRLGFEFQKKFWIRNVLGFEF